MDAAPSYHIIFSGKLRAGFEQAQVKAALAERLKLTPKQQGLLFSGKPLVLKRTDSADKAKQLVAKLAAMGAITRIEASKAAKTAVTRAETFHALTSSTELPRFSPCPRGGKLTLALILAATTEVVFSVLYLLMILASSVGLVYANLFTTWAGAFVSFGPLALLIQLVTMLLGLVVLFLIAKPLLSIKQRQHHGITVDAQQEPQLHAFVQDVCERIGAPVPREISINNDIAVDLGYQPGALGFVLNRTVLSIGAPLVAASDTRQLAALLAQALQLFHSRSLSPHAAFLLRRSDGWLQQAIYGEDEIDRQLADLIVEQGPYAAIARQLQRLIALSRKILGLRLRLSRSINRRLMHRLVADTDKVSLLFTGSTGFQQLIEQQRLLSFASQNILPGLKEQWHKEETLPDNLVQVLVLRCKKYPSTIHQQLRQMQEKEKAASYDTIPADSQRLHRVSKHKVEAAYPSHSPAVMLFRNFSKLSRTMTLRFYHNRLALPVSANMLIPVTAPSKQAQQQQQQIDAIFQQMYHDFVPLKLQHRLKMVDGIEAAMAQHQSARKEMASTQLHTERALKRCVENELAFVDIHIQQQVSKAELWRQWGIERNGADELEQLHHACREQEKGLDENISLLAHQLTPTVQRLVSVLALLGTPRGEKINNAPALKNEVKQLCAVLERIEQSQPQLRALQLHTILLQTLLSYDNGGRGKLHEQIQEQSGEVKNLLTGLGARLKTTPCVFSQAHDNLMSFALHKAYREEGPSGDFDRGYDVVEQIRKVERHALARLCAITRHVEKTLDL